MRQFGDRTAGNRPGDSSHCAECEAMLADALDGTLSPAEQQLFESHTAECGPCAQALADARRGAAWLEMLRTPAPEPPADLVQRILAGTSGMEAALTGMAPAPRAVPAMAPGYAAPSAGFGGVAPLRTRAAAWLRRSAFAQIVLEPRLAMTAAMAFFSIALTMDLTGIRPLSLRASDLTPDSLKRDFVDADASVVRYYEGLRVVYELESRVHDLESDQDNDASASAPAQPGDQPSAGQQPAPAGQQPRQPGDKQHDRGKAAPSPGTSRREGPQEGRRVVVAYGRQAGPENDEASTGRKLV